MNFCHEQKEHHDFGSQKKLFWDLGRTKLFIHLPARSSHAPQQSAPELWAGC